MELYLIRHTRTAVAPGICYGRADVALADSFARDAASVRDKLAGVTAQTCYSSPLARCSRLAEALGHAAPRHEPRLQELDFGTWELQPWEAIPRAELDLWGQEYVDRAPPGGETFRALHARASAFLRELASMPVSGAVLAVTHAGVIRALLAEVLGLPLQDSFRFHLDYGGVTRLDLDGASAVGYVNR